MPAVIRAAIVIGLAALGWAVAQWADQHAAYANSPPDPVLEVVPGACAPAAKPPAPRPA